MHSVRTGGRSVAWLAVVGLVMGGLVVGAPGLGAERPKTGRLRFERVRLVNSWNEGCALGDVNRDGRLDVIAGPAWYEAPMWRERPLRHVGIGNDEFMENNGDHAMDLNGDGWVDVISASWLSDKICWYENPGQEGLAEGRLWKEHVASEGFEDCEGTLLVDLDGDGVEELLVNTWGEQAPLRGLRITPGKGGRPPAFKPFELGRPGRGHGVAVGDINGDGRVDVVVPHGWFEAPEGDRFSQPWKFHGWHKYGHFSVPGVVTDVNGDGKNDIIIGHAHNYGLYWLEQGPVRDGEITWTPHEIDKSISQMHVLVWADLDGDGRGELITGKRHRPHKDEDPGAGDPVCLVRYLWNASAGQFERDVISYDEGVGTGMQIRVADLDGDNKLDIAVAGKTGTYVLLNRGPAGSQPAGK